MRTRHLMKCFLAMEKNRGGFGDYITVFIMLCRVYFYDKTYEGKFVVVSKGYLYRKRCTKMLSGKIFWNVHLALEMWIDWERLRKYNDNYGLKNFLLSQLI